MPTRLFSFRLPLGLYLLLPLVLLAPLAQAQRGKQEDVVYLKNGGIMRGKILEITDDFTIKIETVGRNVFVFPRTEVERISREREQRSAAVRPKERGYVNMTELGVLTGQSAGPDWSAPVFYHNAVTLQTFNGYKFLPLLQAGLSTGIDLYQNFALVPVAAGLRGDLSRSPVTPFYSLDVGYGFAWLNDNNLNQRVKGGLMLNPGVGLKIHGNRYTAWVISLGYKSQQASTFTNWGWQWTDQRLHYKRLAIRTGLSF